MKVAISAYACEPGVGSEPQAGWAFVKAASINHEVWLFTRRNNAAALAEPIRRVGENLHVIYLDLPARSRRWKRGQRGIHVYYALWQRLLAREVLHVHREVGFDVLHHLTFASDWLPVGLTSVEDVPLIWGPVGGTTGTPWTLWRWLGIRGILEESLRTVVSAGGRRMFGEPVAARARLVVANNGDVERRFSSYGPTEIEPHVAIDPDKIRAQRAEQASRPEKTAVYAGRLAAWKGVHLAVDAMARPESANWSLDIYGDGKERSALKRRVRNRGLRGRVRLLGARPRREVLDALSTADAFLFPSFHDSAPWAVAEAVTAGCPVVCLDRGGPAVLVDQSNGIRVPVAADADRALAEALCSLTGRSDPTNRWSFQRLPEIVDRWYLESVGP